MSRKKEDSIIRILEYLKDNGEKGASYAEIHSNFLKIKTESKDEDIIMYLALLLAKPDECYAIINVDQITGVNRYVLSPRGYFKLLQHRELNEARQSSNNARWAAIIAIAIGVIVGTWQIILTYCLPK